MTDKESAGVNELSEALQGTWEKDEYYKLILKSFPNHDQAWKSRSVAYNKRGLLNVGFKYLDKAVELNPLEHLGYRGYVKLYMMHDYLGALSDFHRYENLVNEKIPVAWGEDLYKLMGLCYLLTNDFDKAEHYLNQSITLNSEQSGMSWVEPRTFLYLAIAQHKNNKTIEAVATLKNAMKVFPTMSSYAYWLGKLSLSTGDVKAALRYATEAEQLFKKYRDNANPYYEIPFQLYQSDIKELQNLIK